jgi:hypothetical protein
MATYASVNFKTKKAFKQAVEVDGAVVTLRSPGLGEPPSNGSAAVSGPWFPEAHKWYASVEVVNGIVTKVT